jgi:hypothetical protein
VPWWRESAADLHELRSRYEAVVRRLLGGSTGAGADAAAAAARLVTRGLTEAHELTVLAGARRARLSELNERMRATMPEPVRPAEHGSEFLGHGRAWLTPPDFDRADAARLNAAELARDLMRDYERATSPEALAEDARDPHRPADGHPRSAPGSTDRFTDSPTVPLSVTRQATAAPAWAGDPTEPSRRPAAEPGQRWDQERGHEPSAAGGRMPAGDGGVTPTQRSGAEPPWGQDRGYHPPPAGGTVPAAEAGPRWEKDRGHLPPPVAGTPPAWGGPARPPAAAAGGWAQDHGHPGADPALPRWPHEPDPPWHGLDFGPRGHAAVRAAADEQPAVDEQVVGRPPPLRNRLEDPPPALGTAPSPFDPDAKVFPPVIGGE